MDDRLRRGRTFSCCLRSTQPVEGPSPDARIGLLPTTKGTGELALIYVTRLDGSQLVVNADLIETVETTADTVITLLDGKKLVVQTHVEDVVNQIIGYRHM